MWVDNMYVRVADYGSIRTSIQNVDGIHRKFATSQHRRWAIKWKYSERPQIPALSYHDSPQVKKLTRLCQS